MGKKITITIDGKDCQVKEGLTILEAAKENQIHIPTLCHHDDLSSWGGCRLCVVQVDNSPKLAASCVTPVRDGMEVVTSNENILESRRTVLEFIFSERNHNCMFCPKSGDCELQKLAYDLQMDHLTVSTGFNEFPTDITSDYMGIDHNRCVLCGRCVRACNEISGARVLNFVNRGPDSLIGIDLNETRDESGCSQCGACIQVCPTGAIFNRYRSHYAVKGHKTDWDVVESFCSQCGLLCPAVFSTKDNNLIKVEGLIDASKNPRPDRGQLCYKLRFEALKNNENRVVKPLIRNASGDFAENEWDAALDVTAKKLLGIRNTHGQDSVLGLISSHSSNEELTIFKDLLNGCFGDGSTETIDGTHFRNVRHVWEYKNIPLKEASWEMIPDADYILLIGTDLHRTQPLISSLILKSVFEKKINVTCIGEDDSIKSYVKHFIPIKKPEQYPAILEHINKLISSPQDQAGVNLLRYFSGAKTGRVPKALKDMDRGGALGKELNELANEFNSASNPLIIVGDIITSLNTSDALQEAIKMANSKNFISKDTMRLVILKPYGNSAGAWKIGLPSTNEIQLHKELKAGIILFKDKSDVRDIHWEIFKDAEFLTVISPYLPDPIPDNVHVIIPNPMWMEEDGTYTSVDGIKECFTSRVFAPPEGVKDTWVTLVELMERMGLKKDFDMPDKVSKRGKKGRTKKKQSKKQMSA